MAVARILREEDCDCLVACTGDLLDLPAGYAASRQARIRFAAYLFDDYEHQWIDRRARSHAERWAPTILRNASVVLVPNEFLQEEYYSRYGIRPAVVRNPSGLLATADVPPWPREPGRVRIVYTGAVYQAHYDAFRNLVAAIRLSHRGELELHIYTAQPFEELRREGILGPVVYHRHVDLADAEATQRQADILFLPLAFTSPYPASIVRTSAPGKMGEYLASGRPVLVHAPPDSFVSWYFRHHMCGTVVDQDDPSALMEALCRMTDDEALRQTLARKGLERAREDFDPGKNLSRFLAAIERGEQR
jgi:glycosyltransferase involved in cell wall biosynthesis